MGSWKQHKQLLGECGLTRPQVEARPGWAAEEEVVFTVVQVVFNQNLLHERI